MQKLKLVLQNRLKNAQRIAFLGIGSELRGDDVAGMLVAEKLEDYINKQRIQSLKVFSGGTAPENLTGQIRKFNPSHLVIIDSLDFQKKPGAICVADIDKEVGSSFSTHKMPIHILRDYLFKSIGCQTTIIGIQPQSLDFCLDSSPVIQESAKILSEKIIDVLKILYPKKEK